MKADTTPCADCGMPCTPREYHPYAACLMFKACHNSDTVRANLATARAPAPAPPQYPPMPEHWAVVASVNGKDLLCISDNALAGSGELSEAEEQAIIGMAQHLLAFVGYGVPPCNFDPDDGARWGAPAASGEPAAEEHEQAPAYRLLERSDRIAQDDEFLDDDATTWATDAGGLFVGMLYAPGTLRPGRRVIKP